MKNKKWIFFVAPPAAVLVIGLCGEIVKWLWNWLVPSLLGLRAIDFWQALGLLLLCRMLFGSWGGGGGGGGDRHQGRCRRGPSEPISPEERERFRKGWGWGEAGQQEPNPESPAGPQPA